MNEQTKTLKYGEGAQKALMNGVKAVAEAVTVTLGPSGRTVIIQKPHSAPVVTKDGVSVAKEIHLKEPFEEIGAQFLIEVASKTNDDAGDGTTTATVLAYNMMKMGMSAINMGANRYLLKQGMNKASEDAVALIKKASKPVTTAEELVNIATISANNDSEIGELLASAFEKVGKDGVITVDESKTAETTVSMVDGMQFDRGYISPYFANPETASVAYKNAVVFVSTDRISTMKDILPVLSAASKIDKPLIVIAEEIEGEALAGMVLNTMRGSVRSVAVKAPGFGDQRRFYLEDIAILTGAKLYSKELGDKVETFTENDFGQCSSVGVTRNQTTLAGGNGSKPEIENRVKAIAKLLEQEENAYDRERLMERMAKLSGGIAVIYVGAGSETELKEKEDRVEDTISATRAALAEGIVPGSGLAYINAVKEMEIPKGEKDYRDGYELVMRALKKPMECIANNANGSGISLVDRVLSEKDPNMGTNVKTGKWVNLIDDGVIDPAKVSCTALRNAVSVASTLITTDCAICFSENEKE